MRRTLALLGLLSVIAVATVVHSSEHHVKADLVPIDNSGVTGFVQLTQLPHGGANLHVVAEGLTPGTAYASFYYESDDCSAPADEFEEFTAKSNGRAELNGKIDEDLDEVGSVSVRLGPGYGNLVACASIPHQN
ncbi:MAG TPA: hypothetical protein VNM87_08140 [Candidatus Udaeobacter sp.]|nr:hypothetical protein [Candidatus Udaeobacter sp.]